MLYSKMLTRFSMPILTLSLLAACGNESEEDEAGRFEFAAASYSVNESGGVVEITINRLDGSNGAVTIDWQTQDDTATSTQDFGSVTQTSLTFADGETSRTETITIANDDMVENDETFNVLLSHPTGGASLGTVASTAVTIINDDSDSIPEPGRFEFGAANYSVSEGGGVVEITINRVDGSDGTATVDWRTVSITATPGGDDYESFGWTMLSFADGETSRTEPITIINDEVVESDETFDVRLSNPTGGASMGTLTTTVVTITNDDNVPALQPGRFEFGAANYSVSESGGVVEITINRVGGSDGAVTIDWQTQDGTATSTQDFGSVIPTSLSFANGETSRTETITIVNDDVVENDETFNVLLSNPTGGASMGTVNTVTVTITNDDSDPLPSLSVVSTSPASQAYGIQLNRNITIEFSNSLDCQNISSQTISLINNNSDLPTTLTCIGTSLTVNPVADFTPSTTYTLVVSSNITSDSGTSMVEDYSWTFTAMTGSALPLLDEWESNMLTEGERWGQYITNLDPAPGTYNEQNMTYYDGQRVFYQIADYTGQQEPWSTYAQEAERVYLNYLENRTGYYGYNYSVPGYRRFPHGFYMDWLRTADAGAAISIVKIRDNPAYSNPERAGRANEWYWSNLSREVAYALNGHVIAERAGNARNNERVPLYLAMALNHIDEWVTGVRANPNVDVHRFAPFMAGLTAEALIGYYEWEVEQGNNPDNTIPEALKSLADYLWTGTVYDGVNQGEPMWVADIGGTSYPRNDQGGTGYGAFRYEDRQNPISAIDGTELLSPGLNMLIAPLYAWLFNHYADVTYIEQGDLIWEGGVALSDVGWNTKIFNQNYRWSFDYVKWRNEGFLTIEE